MRVLRFSSTEDVNRGGNFFSMGHTCQGGRTRLCSCLSIAESPEAMCTKEQRALHCRAGTCFLPCFIIQGKSSTGFRRHNQTTAVSLTEAAMTKREVLHVLTTSVRSWILRHGRIRTDILSFSLFRHHWLESLASGKRITLVLISLSIKWG